MTRISNNSVARIALGALFGISTVLITIDNADGRGRGGGHGGHMHGGHHGGGHGGGHHGGGGHRPGGGGGHHGGGGGHHGGGGNHYHHHSDNWHHHYNHHGYYDHYGRWVAGAVTAAAIGSIVYSLPPACRVIYSGNVKYWDCNGVYYRAQYQGSDVNYVVVNKP